MPVERRLSNQLDSGAISKPGTSKRCSVNHDNDIEIHPLPPLPDRKTVSGRETEQFISTITREARPGRRESQHAIQRSDPSRNSIDTENHIGALPGENPLNLENVEADYPGQPRRTSLIWPVTLYFLVMSVGLIFMYIMYRDTLVHDEKEEET